MRDKERNGVLAECVTWDQYVHDDEVEVGDDMTMDYDLPENQRPAGPGIRLSRTGRTRMAGHVPVRFPAETIASIKELAARDGVSVSNWIRAVVGREVQRHRPSSTEADVAVRFVRTSAPKLLTSTTVGQPPQRDDDLADVTS